MGEEASESDALAPAEGTALSSAEGTALGSAAGALVVGTASADVVVGLAEASEEVEVFLGDLVFLDLVEVLVLVEPFLDVALVSFPPPGLPYSLGAPPLS